MLKIQTVIGNWSIILCQLLTGIIQYNHTKKEVGYFLEKWKIISCKFDVDCLNVVWSTIMVWHGLTLEQGKCSHWQLCAGHCSHRMWHAMDLSQFGRKSFISQRALEEVLTVCKSNLDELATTGTSRTSIKRSRDTAFDTNTPYGKLMQRFTLVGENGEAVSVDFISPQAMLWHACSECPKFARAVQQMLVKERPTIQKPLTVCLYADEISPGNNLKRDNRRRVQAIYWSIRQLGPMQLSMESSWFFFHWFVQRRWTRWRTACLKLQGNVWRFSTNKAWTSGRGSSCRFLMQSTCLCLLRLDTLWRTNLPSNSSSRTRGRGANSFVCSVRTVCRDGTHRRTQRDWFFMTP